MPMKRQDYISWDEYFMGVAMLAARRSKDPSTQVGACIVSPDNIIISTGYNGTGGIKTDIKQVGSITDGFCGVIELTIEVCVELPNIAHIVQ